MRVFAAGPREEQLAWAERCAMLSMLRHPRLNALIDYGVAGARALFEAYEPADPFVSREAADALLSHARRFVRAHGVTLTIDLTRRLPGHQRRAGWSGRAVGLVLQPRRALLPIAELIAAPPAGGVTRLTVAGPPGSGLRTLLLDVARLARAAGYVPLSSAALLRWPELSGEVADRHVCMLSWSPAPRAEQLALAALFAKLAGRSARAHICLTADRTTCRAGPVIHLDSMGTTEMSSMVYRDVEGGPTLEEIFAASRRAAGSPGRFLSALGAGPFGASGSEVVHESPAPYDASGADAPAARLPMRQVPRRLDAAITRARPRALQLLARGRHAAAGRLLARAARVLQGRGDAHEASRCWLELAWMTRNRGATMRAVSMAEQAAALDPAAATRVAAVCLMAVCWTDEVRFTEAEASLRSLAVAASTLDDSGLNAQCLLAMARVLYWSGRLDEALATLEPLEVIADPAIACEALARGARTRLRAGELPRAVSTARDACRRAAGCADPRLRVGAHRAMAEALLAAGDPEAAYARALEAVTAAAAARLPLAVLRLRALLARILEESPGGASAGARLRSTLDRCRRRALPALLRRQIDEARGQGKGAAHVRPDGGIDEIARVGQFLDVAQRAPDDSTAIGAVLTALGEQVSASSVVLVGPNGGILTTAGRPWRERPAAADQALASGQRVGPRPDAQPEAGEPVRCGGTLLGAIGCRWSVGARPPGRASAIMQAASLAVAVHARNVIEAAPAASPPAVWGDLLGESAAAIALRESIARAARAPFPVLIEGESGSGKELVARAIHRLSPRHPRRCCAINCAALTDDLVEAELFGHARGAYTGATTDRAGLFEEADGGTLFLDEVGELSARAQAKLLRVLQEGEVRRVGENFPRRVDVRIVAATNRQLDREAAGGRFRTDLHFRLDVLRITVPPLRERITDIPILAQHFWQQACARIGSRATLGADALSVLARYDWPGNVRELQNAIAWTVVHGPRRGRVAASALPARLAPGPMATGTFEAAREAFERRYVRAALAEAGGQRQVAARALGISRQGLAKMLRRLGLEREGSP